MISFWTRAKQHLALIAAGLHELPNDLRMPATPVAWMYAAVFTVYGLHVPYLAVWLASRDLGPEATGWILAVPLFVRLIATPSAAIAADADGSHAAMILRLSVVGLVATFALGFVDGAVAIGLGVLVVLVAIQSLMPLIEVVAMRSVRSQGTDYGRQRLWGSLTFIAMTMIGGLAIAQFGGGIIQPLLVVATLFVVIAALQLQRLGGERDGMSGGRANAMRGHSSTRVGGDLIQRIKHHLGRLMPLLKKPGLVAFLLGAGLVQASHAVYYTFSALHWQALGMSGFWIGALWSLGVVAEIVLFAWSGTVVRRLGPLGLLQLGAAAAVVRWTAMSFDPPLLALIQLQILHGLTFGATHLAAMFYIARNTPETSAGAVQALFATIATGGAMGAATLLAGYLYADVQAFAYFAMAGLGLAVLVYSSLLWLRGGGQTA